ncbi:MAG: electron transport complex subunit RsxC, partial [Candidatus Omnitrophica bacterium]|nr:electron transport complex subunit RsxC [Candidatus Omnitrophota bacterium]
KFHPALGFTMSVVIETDKSKSPGVYNETGAHDLAPDVVIGRIKDSGIVGMGGAAFPTHVKLTIPDGKKIKTLIINGAECEPFLTCDHTLMVRKTAEVGKGIELIMDIVRPEETYIAVEDNKKAAFFAFQKAISFSKRRAIRDIHLVIVKTKYPQGGEKQLVKAITGIEVPPGKLPLDVGCLIQNVGTAYAISEAIYRGKPLIERIVTISGDCLDKPGNYVVRVGTTIREMLECHGIEFKKEPKKVVVGGPMMGFAQPQLEVPILKNTSGILFLSDDIAEDRKEGNCLKCAKCVDVCPLRLSPTEIIRNVRVKKWDAVEKLYVSDCMECGACAYSCPSRIPLVQYIKEGKMALEKRKR